MLREVEVVEPPISVRQHSTDGPVQGADHAAIAVGPQPGVDVAVQQCRLVMAHAFEVGERDLELVGELVPREAIDAVFNFARAGLDEHLEIAALIGTALQ